MTEKNFLKKKFQKKSDFMSNDNFSIGGLFCVFNNKNLNGTLNPVFLQIIACRSRIGPKQLEMSMSFVFFLLIQYQNLNSKKAPIKKKKQ